MATKSVRTVLKELAGRGHEVTLEQLSQAVGRELTERSMVSQPVDELEAQFKAADAAEPPADLLTEDDTNADLNDEESEDAIAEVALHRPAMVVPPTTSDASFTARDLRLTQAIKDIQKKCRSIREDEQVATTRREGERPFKLFRPKYDERPQQLDGTLYYAYDSILEGDGKILISLEEHEAYYGGKWQYRHMPFVSEQALKNVEDLLRQYSMYTEVCVIGGEPLNTELDRKAKLILQRRYNPPGWLTVIHRQLQQGKIDEEKFKSLTRTKDLEFPRMCYAHYLLLDDMDIVREEWMMVTIELQRQYSGPELREQRIGRLVELINKLHDRINERRTERGGELVSKDQVGEILIDFARKVSGGDPK